MARKRAVILEVDGRVARVLASGGEFRTIRAPRGLGVGDEVNLDAPVSVYNWRPQLALVATLVIMLAFGSAGLNTLANSFNEVAAYVTVDINPSVELGVNRWGWVISARGLNAEGVDLLGVTDYHALKLAELVPELARLATDRGYIAEGKPNTVIVAAAPAGTAAPSETVQHEMALAKQRTAAAVTIQQGPPVTVTTIVTPDQTLRNDAEAMNISVGRLAVVLEARESGVPVRVSDVERDGLAKAIESAGGKLHDLVVKAQDEGNYHDLASQYTDQLKHEKDDDDKGKGHDKDSGGGKGTGAGSADPGGTVSPGTGGVEPGQGSDPHTGAGEAGSGDKGSAGAGSENTGGGSKGSGDGSGSAGNSGTPGSGSGSGDSGNQSGNDKDKGKDKNKGGDMDQFTDRIRDGLRELGERIKHQMGKGKDK